MKDISLRLIVCFVLFVALLFCACSTNEANSACFEDYSIFESNQEPKVLQGFRQVNGERPRPFYLAIDKKASLSKDDLSLLSAIAYREGMGETINPAIRNELFKRFSKFRHEFTLRNANAEP